MVLLTWLGPAVKEKNFLGLCFHFLGIFRLLGTVWLNNIMVSLAWRSVCLDVIGVHSLTNTTFRNTQWEENEVIFDINLPGEVKTPYDDEFGRVEGTGEIVKVDEENGEVVAKIMGSYGYANNQKICRFVAQTD